MLPGIVGAMAGISAGGPFFAEYLGTNKSDSDLSTYTFSTESLGVVDATREIFVLVSWAGDNALIPAISSATIGGVSATILKQDSLGDGLSQAIGAGVISAAVPTGTTGNIVINFSQFANACAIGKVRVLNRTSLVGTASAKLSDPSTPGTISVNIDVGNLGAVMAAYTCSDDGFTVTWTNATKQYEGDTTGSGTIDKTRYSGALSTGLASQSGRAISTSQTINGSAGLVIAAVSIA